MASGLSSMANLTKCFLGLLFLMMMQPFNANNATDFAGNRDDQGTLGAPAKYEKGDNSNEGKTSKEEGQGDGDGKDKGKGKGKEVKEDEDDGNGMDVDDGDHQRADDDDNDKNDDDCEFDESSSDDDDSDDDDDFDIYDDFSDIEAELEAMRRQDGKVKEF